MNQVHVKRASLFYLVFVMYSYTTGGPFGLEAQVSTAGPGMALIYFFGCSVFLMHSDVSRGSGADDSHAGGGWFLPLGARCFRRFLGFPRGMVELERRLPSLQRLMQ